MAAVQAVRLVIFHLEAAVLAVSAAAVLAAAAQGEAGKFRV